MLSDLKNATFYFPETYQGILCVVSCSLSIIGCFAILYSYIKWREQRTTARLIVICIAVADMFTAVGYLIMASFFLNSGVLGYSYNRSVFFSDKEYSVLRGVCAGQSLLTTTSSMWSFWWTTVLAVHMYLGFVWNKWSLSRRCLPIYFGLCWGVPPVCSIPAMATGWLGLGCWSVSVTWCFVGTPSTEPCNYWVQYVLEAVEGKMWEIGAFLLISVLYVRIWIRLISIRRKRVDVERSLLLSSKRSSSAIDWTVVLIPLVFLFIRAWGTVRYFLYLGNVTQYTADSVLSAFQAIFDPSQGWTNAVIFLLLSRKTIDGIQTLWQGFKNCVRKDINSLKSIFSKSQERQVQEPLRASTPISYRDVSRQCTDSDSFPQNVRTQTPTV